MSDRSIARVLEAEEGPSAPPRSNGELVFAAPWESRSFGIAVALAEGRRLEWEGFRQRLIAAIAAAEHRHETTGADVGYYGCWLEALERLLVEERLLDAGEIDARGEALAHADAHEHDGHTHSHAHDHDDHPGPGDAEAPVDRPGQGRGA